MQAGGYLSQAWGGWGKGPLGLGQPVGKKADGLGSVRTAEQAQCTTKVFTSTLGMGLSWEWPVLQHTSLQRCLRSSLLTPVMLRQLLLLQHVPHTHWHLQR